MLNRPRWDDFFMLMAFWAARRSPDPHTQHGCIIADNRHRVIAEGFNGYPAGCREELMPKTRPEKYLVTLHAEDNAILHSLGDLRGATIYVTGEPCSQCWCRIIQKGIARVVIGPKGSHMVDEAILNANRLLLAGRDVEIVRWTPDQKVLAQHICDLLKDLGLMEETLWALRDRDPAGFAEVFRGE